MIRREEGGRKKRNRGIEKVLKGERQGSSLGRHCVRWDG